MAARTLLGRLKLVAYAAYLAVIVLFATHIVRPSAQRRLEQHVSSAAAASSDGLLPQRVAAAVALRYVPASTASTWAERNFLLVFGIPSVDVDGRRRRRNLQRTTCWQYPGVATRANAYAGEMLVLYVLARHQQHNYTYSAALEEEAAQWHDVLALPMNEGRVTTNKTIGGVGNWGTEAEVGMSRKTFLWFDLALRLFPTAAYVAKGDDDMFLRVPQYLADLHTLPLPGVYWGFISFTTLSSGNVSVNYYFAFGSCYTLSRDVAEAFVSYEPVRRLVALPYTKEREAEFEALEFRAEDAMVGLVLKKSGFRHVLYVKERRCAFHDVHSSVRPQRVSSRSVMVHHVWESEYAELLHRFANATGTVARRRRRVKKGMIMFACG